MTETGFTNAAVDSAHAFRVIMQAMSRPGVPVRLEAALEAPAPLACDPAAVALTLCDFQTPVWLSPALRNDRDRAQYLRFHTGAPIVERDRRRRTLPFCRRRKSCRTCHSLRRARMNIPTARRRWSSRPSDSTASAVGAFGPRHQRHGGFRRRGPRRRPSGPRWRRTTRAFRVGVDVIFAAPGSASPPCRARPPFASRRPSDVCCRQGWRAGHRCRAPAARRGAARRPQRARAHARRRSPSS